MSDYSKANEALKMFGGDFQKMMECLSDWAEKMVKSDKEEISEEEEEEEHISSSSTYLSGTKVERFENDDAEPIFLLKNYTIENVPYEIWSKVEPDWNIFCRNYGVLLKNITIKKE